MKKTHTIYLIVFCFLLLDTPGLTAAIDKAQAQKDWVTMNELIDQYDRNLSESNLREAGEKFVDEWNAWAAQFEPFMKNFTTRYGSTLAEVNKSFAGIQRPLEASADIEQLFNSASPINVAEKAKKFADMAAGMAREAYGKWDGYKPEPSKMELKLNYAERALKFFKIAKALDPGTSYDDFISKAEAAVAESEKQGKGVLKDLKWPGHNPEFSGPGDPEKLAAAALEYLRNADHWSKPEYDDEHIPIAACVTATGWGVNKTVPLTGEPTQYRLQMFVAFKGTKDPDIAYGYHMYFYTAEEAGIEKAPPFRYANSYANLKMLMDNVPKGGGGPSADTGTAGLLLRLILGLTLLVAGLVAATPMIKEKTIIKEKAKWLPGICDRLTPLRTQIGVTVLVVGMVCFLKTLVFDFAPLVDLFPQLVAVLLGGVLSKELLFRAKPAQVTSVIAEGSATGVAHMVELARDEAHKVSQFTVDILQAQQDRVAWLEQHQVNLGLLALAAGLIHLLLGGIWLV